LTPGPLTIRLGLDFRLIGNDSKQTADPTGVRMAPVLANKHLGLSCHAKID